MAIVNTKKYIDLADLTLFKELNDSATAAAIATAEAKSLHTVAIDGNTLKFYREEEPVGSATPAYSITLPQQDLSNYLQKIANATGGKVVQSVADGTIVESSVNVSDLVVSSDLAAVATSGDADDVSYDNTDSGLTATDVQAALDELAGQSAGGVASKTVYITETAGGSGAAYSKRYGIYQGSEGSASSPVVGEKLADIDIPKDMVVEEGEVVDVVYDNGHLYEGSTSGTDVTEEIKGEGGTATSADAGKYIKLTIANSSGDHLWIAAKDLVDIYTAQQNATQVQLAIDNNNVISATIVAGSIGTTELADSAVTAAKLATDAVTTAKIVDEAVTEGKLSQAVQAKLNASVGVTAVAEGTTNGTVSVTTDGTTADVAVHGLGSAAYTASTAYDAAGAADAVLGSASDTSTDITVYGARAYADSLGSNYATAAQGAKADSALQLSDVATESEIRALFTTT